MVRIITDSAADFEPVELEKMASVLRKYVTNVALRGI